MSAPDRNLVRWRKSNRSADTSTCVEVAPLTGHTFGVRDSKNPTGPTLLFPGSAWQAFLSRQGSS